MPSVRTDPVPLLAPAGSPAAPGIVIGAEPGLARRAHLVTGDWPEPAVSTVPAAPVPATLQASAADALGLAVGDTIEAGWSGDRIRFLVTGTWLPDDPSDPSWFADPAAATGYDGTALGPLLVGDAWPERLSSGLGVPSTRWTIVPDGPLTPDDLPRLARAVAELQEGIAGVESATVSGNLDATIARVQRGLVTAQAVAAIPAVLVALLAVITLGRLAGLLAGARRSETELLRARGASVAGLTTTHAAEAALLAVPAAAAGTLASALVLVAFGVSPSPMTLPIAAAVAAGAVITATVVALRHARVASRRAAAAESGRAATAATAGVTLLIAAAAALALRQFLLYRSPLATGPDGSAHLDPLAALAPALGLVALALVALLCFGPVVTMVQSLGARTAGLAVVLPARQVARRPGVFAVALLLVTLAVGGTTLAAGLTGTWSALEARAGLLRNGSDVRVRHLDAAGPDDTPLTAAPFTVLDEVDDAVPVLAAPARIATDTVSLVALRSEALPAVAPALPSAARNAVERLRPPAVGRPLERTATGLSITAHVDPAPLAAPGARVDVFGWVADADGALARLSLGGVPLTADGPAELTAPLPAGRAPWSVLALEATRANVDTSAPVTVRFDGAWAGPQAPLTATATWNHPTGRVMTSAAKPAPLPVLVTDALAGRLGARTGASVSFLLPATGATVDARVAGTLPSLPGSGTAHAILADLRQLDDHLLRSGARPAFPGEVWIRTGHPADVAEHAALVPHVASSVSTADTGSLRPLLATVVAATWWGVAGILALAVVAVASMTVTLAASRRGEVALLRALGVTARAQARLRLAELGVVIAGAFVIGAAAGAIIARLTVPDLARTAVGVPGEAVPAPLLLAWVPWAACLAALALLLGGVALRHGARIRRQAADSDWREETR